MNFQTQLDSLKEAVVKAFSDQYGSTPASSEWEVIFNRMPTGVLVSMTFVTKNTTDEVRLRVNVTGTSRLYFSPFSLQNKKNFGSGTLGDEIFVTQAEIPGTTYSEVFNYVKTPLFQEFLNTKPRIRLINPKGYIKFLSGFPLQTQR